MARHGLNASTSAFNTAAAQSYFTASFVAQYMTGPMLSAYPTNPDGSYLSMGDAPAYFLQEPWQAGFASPAGAMVTDSGSGSSSAQVREGYPLARWIPAIQSDMLALSRWQTTNYAHANHPPAVYIPLALENLTGKPGQVIPLQAVATDPDGRDLTISWFQYPEAGTCPGTMWCSAGPASTRCWWCRTTRRPGRRSTSSCR